ncbi:MAG TPA: hypothetical protein VLX92_11880 [Kofleriaceae bacterium]|nr:hypothetical protein [Kofleriaceae bacterium]
MMKLATLASLVLASLAASAAPTPPTPPGPPSDAPQPADRWRPGGDILLEVDHTYGEDGTHHLGDRSTVIVYVNGAWRLEATAADGTSQPERGGTMGARDLETLRDGLAAATWKVTTGISCHVATGASDAYSSYGKLRWTERVCNNEYLDATSRRTIDDIANVLARVTAPHQPPCCKK